MTKYLSPKEHLLTLCFLLLSFFITSSKAQSFQKISNNQAGSFVGFFAKEVNPDNILITGVSTDNILSPFLQMINQNGDPLWTRKIVFQDSTLGLPLGITSLTDNSIISSIAYSTPTDGYQKVVLKLNPTADNIEWATFIPSSPLFNTNHNLLASESGILTSHFANVPTTTSVLTKLSLSGDVQWSNEIKNTEDMLSHINATTITDDDNYLICGNIYNPSQNVTNGTLIWLDMDGQILKSKTYQNLSLYTVQTFPNGDVLISGHYKSTDLENRKGIVIKTDSNGNIIWSKLLNEANGSSTCSAQINNDGGSVVFIKRNFTGNDYSIIMKLTPQGNIEWQYRLNNNTDTSVRWTGITTSNNENFSLASDSSSTKTILTKTDSDGNINNCPSIATCLQLDNIAIDTSTTTWFTTAYQNTVITIDFEIEDFDIEYTDHCNTPPPPTPDFLVPDTICINECISPQNLEQQSADSWLWSGNNVDIEFPTAQEPGNFCFEESGLFMLQQTIYTAGCPDSFQTEVTVIPSPMPVLPNDSIACDTTPIFIDASTPEGIYYQWDNLSTTTIREIMQSGTYAVTVSNDYCSDSDSINVLFVHDYFNNVAVDLGNDTMICNESELMIGPDITFFDDFEWSDAYTDSPRPVELSGSYTFSATVEGCLYSDSIFVTLENCNEPIFIPNCFSPNGDGTNDIFTAYGNHHFIEELKIFNRWGAVVTGSKNSTFWDGTFNGEPVQNGTYVYIIRYTDIRTGDSKIKSGDITVMR